MKTVKLLLGSGEGRLSKVIETLVRQACRETAVLHTTRAGKVGEFIRLGSKEKFDLAIVVPDHMRVDLSPQGSLGPRAETARAISTVKAQRVVPVLAFTVGGQYDAALLEAGADCVLGIPFKCDEVKSAFQRLVPVSTLSATAGLPIWSWPLGDLLRRGLGFGST